MAGLPPLLSSVIHHQPSYSASDTLIPFDAKVVAHKEEGWEGMLKSVLILWVQKIVEERRLYHWPDQYRYHTIHDLDMFSLPGAAPMQPS